MPPAPPVRWPNITTLLAGPAHITLGQLAHVKGAAIAADEHTVLATVLRRKGESFEQWLLRLDQAIGQALREGVYTNEVQDGHFVLAMPKRRKKRRPTRS
jgi:hypothetical protein